MKVCIFGAGAVGGHIATRLIAAGADEIAVVARGPQLNAIRTRGGVSTVVDGLAASMASVLLCSGAKGKRYALPNATIHMHQALGGGSGQATDARSNARRR